MTLAPPSDRRRNCTTVKAALSWDSCENEGFWCCLQPTVGRELQFSPARQTALTTLTGRRRSPVSKRRRICYVKSEMGTNITTFHHSHGSLVSFAAISDGETCCFGISQNLSDWDYYSSGTIKDLIFCQFYKGHKSLWWVWERQWQIGFTV